MIVQGGVPGQMFHIAQIPVDLGLRVLEETRKAAGPMHDWYLTFWGTTLPDPSLRFSSFDFPNYF